MNPPWISFDGRELTAEEMRVDLLDRVRKVLREEAPPVLRLSHDEATRLYELLRLAD